MFAGKLFVAVFEEVSAKRYTVSQLNEIKNGKIPKPLKEQFGSYDNVDFIIRRAARLVLLIDILTGEAIDDIEAETERRNLKFY